MVTLRITSKTHLHYETYLSELTLFPLKSSLMILGRIKVNYFAQTGFIMEAHFSNNPLRKYIFPKIKFCEFANFLVHDVWDPNLQPLDLLTDMLTIAMPPI